MRSADTVEGGCLSGCAESEPAPARADHRQATRLAGFLNQLAAPAMG
jgi:hypothetical protein